MSATNTTLANRIKPRTALLPRRTSLQQNHDISKQLPSTKSPSQVTAINQSKQNNNFFSTKDQQVYNKGYETSDKQNQNTWFITNEYYDTTGAIPVIPLFAHTNNYNDIDKNHLNNPSRNEKVNPRKNNFRGDEHQDLLSMGRIQELRERMGTDKVKINETALWKCLGSEFLGTFLLMFFGIGCVLKLTEVPEGEPIQGLSAVGVALCWGFTVATLVQALGGVSCDINPAVTLAGLVAGKIPIVKAIMYILMQCLGALAGVAVLKAITPDTVAGDWGITKLAQGVTPLQGFVIELISTFLLVFTAFNTGDENRNDVKGSVPLAIGLCVSAIVLCSGPFTGASLNPARTLAPSIIAGHFDNHWIYWLGPISGAVTAALMHVHVFRALRPDEIEALEVQQQLRQRAQEAKENGSTSPPV